MAANPLNSTHHFGPIATELESTGAVDVDVGSLVRRLILFDRCTVESTGLKEVPALVTVFGPGGFMELVEAGAISIICDVMTIGEIGRTSGLAATDRRGGPLPPGSYHLASVRMASRRRLVSRAIAEVHRATIAFTEVKRLKRRLAEVLLEYPADAGSSVDASVEAVRRGDPMLHDAVTSISAST